VRLGGISTQSLFSALLVYIKVSFADMDVSVTLEGNDMCGKSVKKPSIMSDDNNTTSKVCDAFLQ
jgi:hypothetical protein